MIVAGGILGELSEKRPRPLFLGDENMLGRGRGEERQEQGSQGGEMRLRGKVRLERNNSPGHGLDPHTWDQSNGAFHRQELWSDALCRMQTSLALHL